jgi:hypothetical protein
MIKRLFAILIALPLLSLAPAPAAAPAVYWTRISIVQTAQQPSCTFETAPARLRQQIEDPIGYPFGFVSAWSCSGDAQAVVAELETRAAAMQAEAAAYRQAHPIGGVR